MSDICIDGRILLKDVVFDGNSILDWDYLSLSDEYYRIYYKQTFCGSVLTGFYFTALEGSTPLSIEDINSGLKHTDWLWSKTEVQILYQGVAYIDGVRHLYMGSSQANDLGYVYYPHLNIHIEIFQKLIELEERYCNGDQNV